MESGITGVSHYKTPIWPFAIGGAVVVLLILAMFCIRIVGVGQSAVISRFGNINRTWGSGVHVKMPWPIEAEAKFDNKVQKDEVKAAASTIDLQDVNATLAVNYNLNPIDVGPVYQEVGTDWKNRILDPAIQEAFKATTSQYTAQQLLDKRPEVKTKVVDTLRKRLQDHHITLDDISIVNFDFSASFTKAIEDKQVAQQQAQQASFNLQKATLDSQANQVQTASLTASILEQQAISKWDGHLPGTVAGADTIFNIPLK